MIEQASHGSNGSLRHYRAFCYAYAGTVLICVAVIEGVSDYCKKHNGYKDTVHFHFFISPMLLLIGFKSKYLYTNHRGEFN